MSKQERIVSKQNEPSMLECQCAARFYYNRAEKRGRVAFAFSLASVFSIFLPCNGNDFWNCLLLCFPAAFGMAAILLYFFMGKDVKSAAFLRNYFDAIVLEINSENYTDTHKRSIKEKIHSAIVKDVNWASAQITNTGKDNPPGVKNWYEFSKDYSDREVAHECQRQNIWWDKRQIRLHTAISFVLLIAILILFSALLSHGVSALRVIVCAASFVITFFDRIVKNINYFILSIKLDGMSENADCFGNPMQIAHIQEAIAKRRELPITGINYYHKKMSKKLSERYVAISADES